MKVSYSDHAETRKKQRQISESEILGCLNNYDTKHTDKKGNPVYRKVLGGRGVKVVVSKDDNHYIITVADY